MTINLFEVSLPAHHVDNFLFVGVGRRTWCQTLHNLSIPCFYYAVDLSTSSASFFGRREIKRKMNIRTDMMSLLEALAANFTVIHTDIDVVLLGNPVDPPQHCTGIIIHCNGAEINKRLQLMNRIFCHFCILLFVSLFSLGLTSK